MRMSRRVRRAVLVVVDDAAIVHRVDATGVEHR
jgi:hypothetical protein